MSEISSGTRRFPMQDRSRRRLLWISSQQTVNKICQMVTQPPNVFTKLLKIPIAILREIIIQIIVYMDDALLMGWTWQEIMTARDTMIFLLQNLDFFSYIWTTNSEAIRISAVTDKYRRKDTVSLRRKTDSYNQKCKEVYSQPRNSVLSLTKLIGLISSTLQAILWISSLKKQGSYQEYAILGNLSNLTISTQMDNKLAYRISWKCRVHKVLSS